MNPAGNSAFEYAFPGIVGLCAIALLTACGKSDPPQAPSVAALQTQSPCVIPRIAPNAQFSQRDDELLSAAVAGDAGAAARAIEQGANVNASGALKRTPLFAAAFCDRPEVVKLLLEKGGKHDVADANGMLPLHAAVVVGGTGTVKVLIANGANVNGKDAAGRTALHAAAATNQMALVELLLAAKVNTKLRDARGMTAAALAADNGHSTLASAIKQWQSQQKAPQAQPGRPQQAPAR